jgi:hypothetical protein
MIAPSVGRIVHLTNHAGDTLAAIITEVVEGHTVRLAAFPPGYLPGYVPVPVDFSEVPKPNHWSWPPRI